MTPEPKIGDIWYCGHKKKFFYLLAIDYDSKLPQARGGLVTCIWLDTLFVHYRGVNDFSPWYKVDHFSSIE